ncbi:MAG: DoxX family membrane protein [Thermoguttaceae bacterium]
MGILNTIVASHAPCSTFLIRLIAGGTLFSEGILEFLFADDPGVGRFVTIGIPCSEVMAPFFGICEIGCGALLLLGLLTRLAAISMIVNILVAILTTKEHSFWMFNLPNVNSDGFRSMVYEARTEFAMLLSGIFLLIVGAGRFSIDALLAEWCHSCDAKRTLSRPRAWAGLDLGT